MSSARVCADVKPSKLTDSDEWRALWKEVKVNYWDIINVKQAKAMGGEEVYA